MRAAICRRYGPPEALVVDDVAEPTPGLAVAMKGRVLAAASTEEKLDVCRRRGAEATVDYEREDLRSRIRELTDDAARVVIDPVGGPYAEQALRGLARGGVFVTLGLCRGRDSRDSAQSGSAEGHHHPRHGNPDLHRRSS